MLWSRRLHFGSRFGAIGDKYCESTMNSHLLYILPGETRSKDRIIPAEMLTIEHYAPSKDMNLSEEDRRYKPNSLRVTVRGEDTRAYPFALSCYFRPEWTSLEVAVQDMGLNLSISDPVKDEDPIGRSVIRTWFATADGAVYTARRPSGSDMLITELMPIRLDEEWVSEQVEAFKSRCSQKQTG